MNRLELIASLTQGSSTICDIGCDHAYVIIKAIEKYGVKKALAVDIAQGPLENASFNIKNHHLENQVQIICSNGFENVPMDDFDTVILSGMGGLLIVDILSSVMDQLQKKNMILSPNSDIPLVRRFLFEHGYHIVDEHAIVDKGHYYEVLMVAYGPVSYQEYDIVYGPILLSKMNNDVFRKHYLKRIKLIEGILKDIDDSKKKECLIMEKRQINEILNFPEVRKYYIGKSSNFYRTYFKDGKTRPTIIVSPGGGYQYTSPRESEPVVAEFQKLGYHVVVINYRETKEEVYPAPGRYIVDAVHEVLKDSRVGKIFGLGFSAGGHAILEIILHHKDYGLKAHFTGLMLGYPVITATQEYAHLGSFERLLRDKEDHLKLREYLSLETQVTKENAVDLFLWGTFTDESVSVMNSILLVEAYQKVHANVEYHCFPFGGHAMSVANEASAEGNSLKVSSYIARWVSMADAWMQLKLKQN